MAVREGCTEYSRESSDVTDGIAKQVSHKVGAGLRNADVRIGDPTARVRLQLPSRGYGALKSARCNSSLLPLFPEQQLLIYTHHPHKPHPILPFPSSPHTTNLPTPNVLAVLDDPSARKPLPSPLETCSVYPSQDATTPLQRLSKMS